MPGLSPNPNPINMYFVIVILLVQIRAHQEVSKRKCFLVSESNFLQLYVSALHGCLPISFLRNEDGNNSKQLPGPAGNVKPDLYHVSSNQIFKKKH